jgi:hypothetical protein
MQNPETDKLITVEQLTEIAQEMDDEDPVEWIIENISKESAYSMMAAHVVDIVESTPEDQKSLVLMATVTKLLVENFHLNLIITSKNS